MGRAWRIEYEGGLYHVLSRGNERRDIFRDDDDRLTFLDLIGDMSDQYHVDIFAYTLMNNHYHGKWGHTYFSSLNTSQRLFSRWMAWWQIL